MSDHLPQAPGPDHLAQLKTGGIVGKNAIIGILVVAILVAAIVVTNHFYQKNNQKMNGGIAEVSENENVDVPDPAPIAEVEPDPDPAPETPGDQELRTSAIGQILEARNKRNTDFIEQPGSKEAAIDKAYLSALTQIRDGYVDRLEKAADDTFDAQLELRLLAQAERAKDLDAWIGLLSPEPERVPRKSILAFAGNWDSPSGDKVTRWIAHADGRMEIVGKPWKAKWIILENGILEVRWSDKAPYVYTRDGAGWISKAPHLRKLTRGDW